MFKWHCQVVSPFTRKLICFRYDSVLKTPFGCTIHKKGVFLHLGNHKHLKYDLKGCKIDFFKRQRNYLWTSIYFLGKDRSNKGIDQDDNSNKTVLENERSNDRTIENSKNLWEKENKNFNDKAVKSSNNYITDVNDNVSSDNRNASTKSEMKLENNAIAAENGKTKVGNKFTSDTNKEKQAQMESTNKKQVSWSKDQSILEKTCPLNSGNLNKTEIKEKNSSVKQISSEYSRVAEKRELNSDRLNKLNNKSLLIENENVKDHERKVYPLNLGEIDNQIQLNLPNDYIFKNEKPIILPKSAKEIPQNPILEKAKEILRKTTALKQEDEERNVKIINLGQPKGNTNLNLTTRRRQIVDLNKCSTERNFITPVRAMTDFLLKPSDLEGLRKTKRRSPYENDPPITVYWRKDVEAKALDVWGSKENLLKEILKRDLERRRYQQNLFTVKRRLRDYRREQGRETEIKSEQNGLFGSSGKVVLTAIAINGTNFLFKLLACLYTGSHSMFSEAVHSLADTINQLILAYGIHKSVQRADSDHPYGYTNMRYVASLISGVGIFCVGSGLSFYHGFIGLTDPSDLTSFYWAYFILGGSLASEGATLLVACNSIRMGAKKSDMSFSEYVWRGQDPSVNVVLLEDLAAVIGVACAGCCMGLSSYYNTHIPDAVGSFLVGGLLAVVASFIIFTNVTALVGRSIPQERLDKINAELESDVMIRAIHDVKGIDIGNSLVRYKAEMDFDGGELTRSYLDKQDLNMMLEEVKKMQTIDDLEEFMLKHGENIVDMMGGEIDRIELKLRKKHPEIRHCDLEIL